ncbi:MAG: DUF4097 family beta strand repeat protein [Fidelibacterota bacterium]|nr:MAG: DUF4097 family beta strand repeat protein [Candidatus Neomarinimicrobiota bacterium]
MKQVSVYLFAGIIALATTGCDLTDEGVLIETSLAFAGVQGLIIDGVSGDCTIQPADDDTLRVDLSYTYPESCFEPRYVRDGVELEIKEDFTGATCSGSAQWVITTPDGVEIEFQSASGSFSLTGHQGGVVVNTASGTIDLVEYTGQADLNSASGNITLETVNGVINANCASGHINVSEATGELDLNSASGNVAVSDASGELDLNSASGDATSDNVVFTATSSFSSASGDAGVVVAESPAYDLSLSSASGNSVLNYGGNDVQGYFEFTARQSDGTIISPYPFDNETTFSQNGDTYMRKSFTRVSGTPVITISTASGTAELKLN